MTCIGPIDQFVLVLLVPMGPIAIGTKSYWDSGTNSYWLYQPNRPIGDIYWSNTLSGASGLEALIKSRVISFLSTTGSSVVNCSCDNGPMSALF